MGARHSALAVADKLIRLSIVDETPITPMKAQKLTYFCHAWMLGLGNGPLFQDAVESWQHGPVIRALYHELKHYGGDRITEPILTEETTFSDQEEKVIRVVWKRYGELDGTRLSRMTHVENSPWEQTYRRDKRSQIIHNHVIRDYYAALIEQQQG